ncbi:MerR family transcriptional regulator [Streptomyces sp. NBC_01235]|uniref:MerR family transcriptional regulator n=1 Tax=Streptomyces sp. NBC_01235 TaxID=2903788 RepID=UPI002E101D6B|nr:MerR family transcriptional regulator [Streptomyces sp. NBC_01235]
MDGGILYSIGELARRTGLTVKTIRFYSDRGIVVPADRTSAGYRRYGPDAVARLALVRTLRELGLGLDVIRQIVDRELTLGDVAAQHAAALDVQIGILRLRRAVLTAAARRRPTPEEMARMHRLARLTEDERRRLTDDFLTSVFTGLGSRDGYAGARRSMTPELPDDPTDEQLEAWVEWAELSLDPGLRASLRRGVEDHADEMSDSGSGLPRPDVVALARDHATAAVASGITPESPLADQVVAALTADCARVLGQADDGDLRRRLRQRLAAANDPRRDRHVHLLALINGWPPPKPLAPALDWSITALGLRTARR